MQKCTRVELNRRTCTLEHCGRKESLITLDILFQWLGGAESNYTNSSEEQIFRRWTSLNFNIVIFVQHLGVGVWCCFFHLELFALLWKKHRTSGLIGPVEFVVGFVHKIMQTVTRLHTFAAFSPQFIWAWPSCFSISDGSQRVPNLTGKCKSSAEAKPNQMYKQKSKIQIGIERLKLPGQYWRKFFVPLLKYDFHNYTYILITVLKQLFI